MSRLFTFGCSMTEYKWPTWADIISREFDHFENWGKGGGGNGYIFNSLSECIVRNKCNKNDNIVVMWSSITREDRYVNSEWVTLGNVYNTNGYYDDAYTRKYIDHRGLLLRDIAYIHAAKCMLEYYNIQYQFTSMLPLVDVHSDGKTGDKLTDVSDVMETYHDIVSTIRPSLSEVLSSNTQWGRTSVAGDGHPTPMIHLKYAEVAMPQCIIQESTKEWVTEVEKLVRSNKSIDSLWDREISKPTYRY